MKELYTKIVVFMGMTLALSHLSFSQCITGIQDGVISPSPVYQTVTVPTGAPSYFSFSGIAGATYIFTFCSNGGAYSYDTYITITDNVPTALTWNDDVCGLGSTITWTCITSGTYRIYTSACCPCGTKSAAATMAYVCTTCAPAPTLNASSCGLASLSSTINNIDACNLRAGLDKQIAVVIPTAGTYQFDVCGSTWDTYLYLSATQCGVALAFNDNFCALQSGLTYTIPAAGTYYLDIEPFSTVPAGTPFTVNVTGGIAPAAPTPTTAAPSIVCLGGSTALNATSPGSTIQWFTVPSGGVSIGTSASGANFSVTPASTTTYYAQALSSCSITSTTRTAVTVTVNPAPSAPTSAMASPSTVSCGQSTNLSAISPGNTITWFTVATGGVSLGTSASGANFSVNPSGTTTYYAESQSAGGASGTQTFNYTGSVQTFTVPAGVTSINVDVRGAQGGNALGTGGLGARMTGALTVSPGQILNILVGQKPTNNGGGGGSFVVGPGNTPLVIAGGGGGGAGSCCGVVHNGVDASITTSGTAGINASGGVGAGGTSGNGAPAFSQGQSSGAGGGFYTNGGNGDGGSLGGQSYLNGGAGGAVANPGGYGGGGGSHCVGAAPNGCAGGGGGGYSGGGNTGGGGQWGGGGGGGSYSVATAPVNTAGYQTGNGQVIFSWAGSSCSSPTRTPVTVTVTGPAAPTAVTANPSTVSCAQSSNLVGTSAGNQIGWFTAASGGTALGVSASGANFLVNPTTTTTYYAEAQAGTASGTQTFNYTGSVQTFTVPAGVTTLTVDCKGAQGGASTTPLVGPGGNGGRIQGTMVVTAGQVLNIYVGGQGAPGSTTSAALGGYNGGGNGTFSAGAYGGGGGGGASDIRVSPYTLTDRVVVASGGGGGAYNYATAGYDRGGMGGGLTGEAGYSGNVLGGNGYPGGGGSQVAGGTAGNYPGYCVATAGSLGLGGAAGTCGNTGGGGGGGYYGGGGGVWSGGGGGSSYLTGGTHTQGFQAGNGQVTLSWTGTSCTSATRTPVTVTVTGPAAPTAVTATPSTVSCGQSSNLVATSAGNQIAWFTTATGGVALGTSASGANFNVTPGTTTTYYAEAQAGAASGSQTFNYTGSMQTFTVPAGVTTVTLDAYGAEGLGFNGFTPGQGGRAKGDLAVTSGQILNLFVGGQTGFNGGGAGKGGANGGDASDVRVGGIALANRVIVAGGGGGAGGDNWSCFAGNGDGGGGTAVGTNFVGGGGGSGYSFCGANGGNTGGTSGNATHGGGGGGGGFTSGGAGAASSVGTAGSGALGLGGGALMASSCGYTGGGGGGYYGGGGAAGNNCGAGQGGGGSSWTGTLTNPLFVPGFKTGMGQIIISWTGISCTSSSRTPVTVTVGTPAAPTSATASPASICTGGATNLSAISAGNTINWYTVASGGAPIGSSLSGANFAVTPPGTTTYYAETQVGAAGGTQTFNYTGAMQTFTVPAGVTSINLDVKGAQGGNALGTGGLGARMTGAVSVTPGQVLNILVGQKPTNNGGGGGSFVVGPGNTPLVIAGGGGGGAGSCCGVVHNGADASITTSGTTGVNASGSGGPGGTGGNGAPTFAGNGQQSAGGGGFLTAGANGNGGSIGGTSYLAGGAGGAANNPGGYGGGGSSHCAGAAPGGCAGGGGGGYSGGGNTGGGAQWGGGGGGGSYSIATSQVNTAGFQTGNGQVIVTWFGVACVSATRTPVTVTVGPPAAPAPVTATPPSICIGGSTNLNAISAGNMINWFTVATGGTAIGTVGSATNFPVSPNVTTTYYAETQIPGGPGGSQTFNYTGSIVNFTVPAGVTNLTINAKGAQGGAGGSAVVGSGGLGANMSGTFTVTPGQVLKVLVGQQGLGSAGTAGAGGGGGTFVTDNSNNPLIIAGGGGGRHGTLTAVGINANVSTSGSDGYSDVSTPPYPASDGFGGINGNGATGNAPHAGNGGGLLTNGTTALCGGPGFAFVNGGAGGTPCSGITNGGFGGGGGGGNNGGGGGGGYSGGGGSYHTPTNGGGGGSFNNGLSQTNLVNQTGDGQVIISWATTGCTSATRTPITITVNPIPAAPTPVTATPLTLCQGASSDLNATSAGNTIQWFTVASGGSAIGTSASGVNFPVTPATTTTYYAEALAGATCTSPTRTAVSVTVDPTPTTPTPVTATASTICAGDISNLNATSTGNTIQWYTVATGGSNIGTSASGVNFAVSPATTTTYYAEALSASTCVSGTRTPVTVTVNPTPTTPTPVTATASTICDGEIANLNATSAGNTIQWFTVASGGSNIGTSASGVNFPVTPATTTTYYAESALGSCISATRTPVTVTVNPAPSIPTPVTATASTICAGTSSNLNAISAGNTIQWFTVATGGSNIGTSASGANFAVTPGTTTTYYAESVLGTCISVTRTPVTVTVNPTPTAPNPVTATAATICSGLSSNLNAISAGSTIQWFTVATGGVNIGTSPSGANFAVTPATTTTYYAESVIGACISVARTAVTVTVNPAPTAPNPVTATASTICTGASANLNATAAGSFIQWFTVATGGSNIGISASGANFSVSPATTTTYYAQASTGSCVSATRTAVTVTVNPLPTAPNPVTATPSTICSGSISTLNATSTGNTIQWYTVATGGSYIGATASGANFVVTPPATTTYYAESALGACVSATRTPVTVTVDPVPSAPNPVSANASTICVGGSSNLNATSAGNTIQWFTVATGGSNIGTSVSGANFPVIPASTTTYYAEVLTGIGCLSATRTPVTVTVDPVAVANAGNGQTICYGSTVTLGANSSGGANAGTWTGGTGGYSSTANPNATYTPSLSESGSTLTLTWTTNATGACLAATDTVHLSINAPAVVNAGADISTCGLLPVTMGGSMGGTASTVTWSGSYAGTASNINDPNATYTPALSEIGSTVTLVLTTNDPDGSGPCPAVSDAANVIIGGFSTTIAPSVPSGTPWIADYENTDIFGWTHYYDNANTPANYCDDYLLLSIQNTNSGGNAIGHVGDPGFMVKIAGQGAYSLTNATTPYVDPGVNWYLMGRYWEANPVTQPVNDVNVKFYFTNADFNAVNAVSPFVTASPTQMAFYKINDGVGGTPAYNPDPALLHAGIPAASPFAYNGTGYWQYYNGVASTSNWAYSAIGTDHVSEYAVDRFSGGGGGGGTGNPGAFPIELLNFTGYNNGSENILEWTTTREINNKEFVLLHSLDNIVFEEIAIVPTQASNGMSNSTLLYSSKDMDFAEKTYYRLKQIDIDGTARIYPATVEVNINNDLNTVVSLFPNPANEVLNVSIMQAQGGKHKIEVYDAIGKLVAIHKQELNSGNTIIPIDVSNLSKGTYILMIKNAENGNVANTRFIKE